MKKLLSLLAGTWVLTFSAGAATVAAWTFEPPNAPGTLTNNTMFGVSPSFGTGTAMGFHASSATVFSSAIGNGSATSWAAKNWTFGDYWQFQTSTIGFTAIQLSFAQRANLPGPTNFSIVFSVDGTNFTTAVAQYNVRSDLNGGAWDSSTPNVSTIASFNLSAFTQLNNASEVYFRLKANIPGTESRIDDFQVIGTAVPEPATLTLFSVAAMLWCHRSRRQNV